MNISDYTISDQYFKKRKNYFKNIDDYLIFKYKRIIENGYYYITESIDYEQNKEIWKIKRLDNLKKIIDKKNE